MTYFTDCVTFSRKDISLITIVLADNRLESQERGRILTNTKYPLTPTT